MNRPNDTTDYILRGKNSSYSKKPTNTNNKVKSVSEAKKLYDLEMATSTTKSDLVSKEFSKFLVRERNKRRMKQEEMAVILGIRKHDYETMEKGTAKKNLKLEKMARNYFEKNPPVEGDSDSE